METNPYQAPVSSPSDDSEYYRIDMRRFTIRELWRTQPLAAFLVLVIFGKCLRVRFRDAIAMKHGRELERLSSEAAREMAPHFETSRKCMAAEETLARAGFNPALWYHLPKVGRVESVTHVWLSRDQHILAFIYHTYYRYGGSERYYARFGLLSSLVNGRVLVTDNKGVVQPDHYDVKTDRRFDMQTCLDQHQQRLQEHDEGSETRVFDTASEALMAVIRTYVEAEFEKAISRQLYRKISQQALCRIQDQTEMSHPRKDRVVLLQWLFFFLSLLLVLLWLLA